MRAALTGRRAAVMEQKASARQIHVDGYNKTTSGSDDEAYRRVFISRRICRQDFCDGSVRRIGHPNRRSAAHLRGYGVHLPAGGKRRSRHQRTRAAGDPRAVQNRVFHRCAGDTSGRHPRHHRERAPGDLEDPDQGQQGSQDRRPAQGPERHRPVRRRTVRSLVARPHRAGTDAPVLQPRQIQRHGEAEAGRTRSQPRRDFDHHRRRQDLQDQADQHRRQQGLFAGRDPQRVRIRHDEHHVLVFA